MVQQGVGSGRGEPGRHDFGNRPPRFLFVDHGNENSLTIEHVDYLARSLGIVIETIRPDFSAEFDRRRATLRDEWSKEKRRRKHVESCPRGNCDCPVTIYPPVPDHLIDRAISLLHPTGIPFLDLCILKGRFPSRKAQFCTEDLKLVPINAIIHPILEDGCNVISWIGERADESEARALKPAIQRVRWQSGAQLVLYRPIHKMTAADAFAVSRRHGIKPNPLYLQGMSRVGCMPCINCKKGELLSIARRYPDYISRVREWELIVSQVSRRGMATFFPAKMVPGTEENPSDPGRASIDRAVSWARTTRGGRQFDLLQEADRREADEWGSMCESA